MIDLFELWQVFQSYANTFQGGFWRPQTDFQRQVNLVSIAMWDEKTTQAEKAQEISDDLRNFLITENLIVKQANSYYGTVNYPEKYQRFATAKLLVSQNGNCCPDQTINDGKCSNGDFKSQEEINEAYYDTIKERLIEKIDTQRWSACLEHLTKNPTLESPKMTQVNNGFKVAPRQVSVVVLYYFVKPIEGTFKYTTSPGNVQTGQGDQIIYNQTASQPLNWPETVKPEFIWRLGEIYGAFTKDQFLTAFSSQQKATA